MWTLWFHYLAQLTTLPVWPLQFPINYNNQFWLLLSLSIMPHILIVPCWGSFWSFLPYATTPNLISWFHSFTYTVPLPFITQPHSERPHPVPIYIFLIQIILTRKSNNLFLPVSRITLFLLLKSTYIHSHHIPFVLGEDLTGHGAAGKQYHYKAKTSPSTYLKQFQTKLTDLVCSSFKGHSINIFKVIPKVQSKGMTRNHTDTLKLQSSRPLFKLPRPSTYRK